MNKRQERAKARPSMASALKAAQTQEHVTAPSCLAGSINDLLHTLFRSSVQPALSLHILNTRSPFPSLHRPIAQCAVTVVIIVRSIRLPLGKVNVLVLCV